MYRKTYEIQFHETDCKNRLKTSVLLNFLQDIAADNAEKIGFGYSKIKNKNIGWFLTKYHIKLYKTLTNEGQIHLETESKGAVRIACIRDFDIYNNANEKIGEATSSWVLADLTTGKIVPPSELFDFIPTADRAALRSNFPKIQIPEKFDYEKEFTAKFSDLDVNQHVNNSIYITWAEDTLPLEKLINERISELEIQYKQQVKYNDIVTVRASFDENTNTFVEELKTQNGETVCLIKQKRVTD